MKLIHSNGITNSKFADLIPGALVHCGIAGANPALFSSAHIEASDDGRQRVLSDTDLLLVRLDSLQKLGIYCETAADVFPASSVATDCVR